MTRARKDGAGVEHFGHMSRALVKKHRNGYCGHRAGQGDFICNVFPTWREAMDYTLGKDTPK